MTSTQNSTEQLLTGPNPADKARAAELHASVKGTPLEQDYIAVSKAHPDKQTSAAAYAAFLADIEQLFVVPEPAPIQQAQAEAPTPESTDGSSEAEEVQAPASTAEVDVQGGLFSHLAAMLPDGKTLTFKVLAVKGKLVVGVFPEATGNGDTPVPFTLSASPAWFDAHLLSALTPYTQARQDAGQIAAQIAKQQQEANAQAKAKPAVPATSMKASKPAETKAKKGFTVTLKAADGTQVSAKSGNTDFPITLGKNTLEKASMVTITTVHDLYGTHTKTYNLTAEKEIDLDEQQSVLLTVNTTPEDAAVEVTNGTVTLALHGSRRLPQGKWTVTAEAAEHQLASKDVTLRVPSAGETVTLSLEPSLF